MNDNALRGYSLGEAELNSKKEKIMSNELQVITTRKFNDVELNCYKGKDDSEDFWATREQIGQLLGYENPNKAVANIHDRNADRLNKFSTILKMRNVEGNRTVTRNVIVYNFKGLLEICRYSNQPVANAVIDFLWDVADDIRKHGMYLSDKAVNAYKYNPEAFQQLLDKYTAEHAKLASLQEQIDRDRQYTLLGAIVTALPGTMTISEAANFLRQSGYDVGRNRLYKILREAKLLSTQKNHKNKPTQKGVEQGLVNLAIDNVTGALVFVPRTMLTPKGLAQLLNLFQDTQRPLDRFFEQAEREAIGG